MAHAPHCPPRLSKSEPGNHSPPARRADDDRRGPKRGAVPRATPAGAAAPSAVRPRPRPVLRRPPALRLPVVTSPMTRRRTRSAAPGESLRGARRPRPAGVPDRPTGSSFPPAGLPNQALTAVCSRFPKREARSVEHPVVPFRTWVYRCVQIRPEPAGSSTTTSGNAHDVTQPSRTPLPVLLMRQDGAETARGPPGASGGPWRTPLRPPRSAAGRLGPSGWPARPPLRPARARSPAAGGWARRRRSRRASPSTTRPAPPASPARLDARWIQPLQPNTASASVAVADEGSAGAHAPPGSSAGRRLVQSRRSRQARDRALPSRARFTSPATPGRARPCRRRPASDSRAAAPRPPARTPSFPG